MSFQYRENEDKQNAELHLQTENYKRDEENKDKGKEKQTQAMNSLI